MQPSQQRRLSQSSFSFRTPPRNVHHPPNKKLTAAEAFNKGQLLQYLFCNGFCLEFTGNSSEEDISSSKEYFESNWAGHQPLTPDTWNTTSAVGASERSNAGELRRGRGRRRRGLSCSTSSPPPSMSSPGLSTDGSSSSTNRSGEENIGGNNEWSVAFPKDLTPHLKGKKKRGVLVGLAVPELD